MPGLLIFGIEIAAEISDENKADRRIPEGILFIHEKYRKKSPR